MKPICMAKTLRAEGPRAGRKGGRHRGAGLRKLEAELSELEPADREEMLQSMGLTEPALATLAREAYRLLGLHSFFTAGPKEIRAWEIPVGATARRPPA